MPSVSRALLMTVLMGGVVLFCRVFPFLFAKEVRRDKGKGPPRRSQGSDPAMRRRFRSLAEKAAPPVSMTVLAVNALSAPIRESPAAAFPVLAASLFTALIHLWKRNSLLSILGGTALYMALIRL
jgi:branched-subunit amino acid transport protein AzlD